MKRHCQRCGSGRWEWIGRDHEAGPFCSDCCRDIPEAQEIGQIRENIYNGMTVAERHEQMQGDLPNVERHRK